MCLRDRGRPLEAVCFRLKEAEAIMQKQGNSNLLENLRKQNMTEEILGTLLEKGYIEPLRTEFPKANVAMILNQADVLPCPEKSKNDLQEMLTVPVFLHEMCIRDRIMALRPYESFVVEK